MGDGDPERCKQTPKLMVNHEEVGGIMAAAGLSGFGISLVFHNLWMSVGFAAVFVAGGIISLLGKTPPTEDNRQ